MSRGPDPAQETLTLRLRTVPNPDFGESRRPAPPKDVQVRSLREARERCREYIDRHNVGGGNWSRDSGHLFRPDGAPVARVSYNLRCWAPEGAGGAEILVDLDGSPLGPP